MPPLILIPGMMCDARMWGGIPALLPCDILHALPTGSDTMQALAAEILATAPPTFALAGLSMGGIIAMEVLRQAPQRITHLALLDTNPLPEPPAAQARRAAQIARALSGDLQGVMHDTIPHYLSPRTTDPAIAALCLTMALTLGPQTYARQSLALKNRPDQTQTLAAYKGPTLILMGEHDQLCPRDRHTLMHTLLPHSRLAIIPNAGHLPPLEQPEQTLAELLRWLDQPERPAP